MPAAEVGALRTIGIIAGGGEAPARLADACEAKGVAPFIVAFHGHTDPAIVKGRGHMWARLGGAGTIMKTLKANGAQDVVLIGSIRRPSFSELMPDWTTARFYARLGLRAIGDSDFLSEVRKLIEENGFRVRGAHEFAEDLLTREGALGRYRPSEGDEADITRGIEVARALGRMDVGQSVIVQEGFVLGVEAAEGTDELIRRCKSLKRKGRGGVLVKICKENQDRDLDLPTIGPRTVELAAECGLAGIAVQAGASLVIGAEKVAEIADRHKMFVVGI